MNKKFYKGDILERNGDMEYNSQFVFSCTEDDLAETIEKIWIEWRGESWEEYKSGAIEINWYDENKDLYWSDCSVIYPVDHNEIPESDFIVLKKYFAVLGVY